MKPLPWYSIAGLLIIALSEIAMLLQVEPFWSWHTPIAWTGFVLFTDGFVWARRGRSWLTSARPEFVVLALTSIPLWLVFEFFNLYLRNWHYINLPENPILRNAGYAWAFATIWPAIFQAGDAIAALRQSRGPAAGPPRARPRVPLSGWGMASVAVGLALLAWPILAPSPYLAAPVWLGFILLLDPLNAHFGGESLIGDYCAGRRDRLVNLCASGFACGLLWEFWNYWARTKWIYSVPILPGLKLFEMPVAGYLGFPAFALECFTMYVAVRLLVWRGQRYPISL